MLRHTASPCRTAVADGKRRPPAVARPTVRGVRSPLHARGQRRLPVAVVAGLALVLAGDLVAGARVLPATPRAAADVDAPAATPVSPTASPTPGPRSRPTAAAAPVERGTTTACPALQVQGAGYVDVAGSAAAREVDCLAAYGIAAGRAPDRFSPAEPVTRAELALSLERLGTRAGVRWDTGDAGLTDVAGLPAEQRDAVDALTRAGVFLGPSPDRFDPAGSVRRDQLASVLARLQRVVTGTGLTAGGDHYDDDAGAHEDDDDAVAAAGVLIGTGRRFDPAGLVTREQAAAALARLLDIDVADGVLRTAYAPACLPLSTWTPERLSGAVVTLPVQSDDLGAATAPVQSGVGGLLLFGSRPSARLPAELAALRAQEPDGWPLLVASDEEGGAVQRLAALTGGLPSARAMSPEGPAAVHGRAVALGRTLKALGVGVDLAPVGGLDAGPGPSATRALGSRSFSADPRVASDDVVAFTTGLQEAGVLPAVKHFPGLGTAGGNTDAGPAATAPWPALQQRDVLPFTAALSAGARGVMTSDAVVPGLGPDPVSLSPVAITGVLRQQYGFDGVVFTDALTAGSITRAGFTPASAAVRALAAGADDVLFGSVADAAGMVAGVRQAIVAAVADGRLPVERLRDAARHVAAGLGRPTC